MLKTGLAIIFLIASTQLSFAASSGGSSYSGDESPNSMDAPNVFEKAYKLILDFSLYPIKVVDIVSICQVYNFKPKYFYEVEFEKPGGLVMPLIVEYSYADGSSERVTYPVQLWRKNDASVKKIIASDKELIGVTVDPDVETADVNSENNSWPKKESPSDFEKFKEKIKG